jgi:hypothetical protein
LRKESKPQYLRGNEPPLEALEGVVFVDGPPLAATPLHGEGGPRGFRLELATPIKLLHNVVV